MRNERLKNMQNLKSYRILKITKYFILTNWTKIFSNAQLERTSLRKISRKICSISLEGINHQPPLLVRSSKNRDHRYHLPTKKHRVFSKNRRAKNSWKESKERIDVSMLVGSRMRRRLFRTPSAVTVEEDRVDGGSTTNDVAGRVNQEGEWR